MDGNQFGQRESCNRKSEQLNSFYFAHFWVDPFVVWTGEHFPSMATFKPVLETTVSLVSSACLWDL